MKADFAFQEYEGKPAESLRQEIRSQVFSMFKAYNSEILKEDNFRLMDILFLNGAIRLVHLAEDKLT